MRNVKFMLLISLYFGLFYYSHIESVEWLQNICLFWFWIISVSSIILFTERVIEYSSKNIKDFTYQPLFFLGNLILLFEIVSFGYFFLGGVFAFSIFAMYYHREEVKNLREINS